MDNEKNVNRPAFVRHMIISFDVSLAPRWSKNRTYQLTRCKRSFLLIFSPSTNMSVRLVALTGKKGHGKSTIASYLKTADYGFVEYAFADPIKQICGIMFGFTYEQMHNPVLKEEVDPRYGFSPRVALQKIGSEAADAIQQIMGMEERIWLVAFRRWFEALPPGTSVVVSDCRFSKEEDLLRSYGFTIIRVINPDPARAQTSMHQSETQQDSIKVDYTILNDRTIPDLHREVDQLPLVKKLTVSAY